MSKATVNNHFDRKLYMDNPKVWPHHRGGWTYAIDAIKEHLCCNDGVILLSSVEDYVEDDNMPEKPWVGFIHQLPKNNYKYFCDLERLLDHEVFLKSLKHCHGLFCLSIVIKDYLKVNFPAIPIATVLYPATPSDKLFNKDDWLSSSIKSIVFIGEYMRNFQYFFDLNTPSFLRKILILSPDVNLDKLGVMKNESVEVSEYLNKDEYDDVLASSVVFLNLLDAPANTTIVECITRNTPVVVNRLKGLEEYLGVDYPLFYETENEALDILSSDSKILSGYEYLKSLEIKEKLSAISFVTAIQNTAIYKSIPLPKSQRLNQTKYFDEYDLTVVICSYKRIFNISRILECFINQSAEIKYEIIIWNNNYGLKDELQTICDKFVQKLNLKVIHSTENFYCIIRLAIVSLMKSDILVVCDDDVLPAPCFLEGYLTKYKQYGPNVVLCCRGHKWRKHELDEENPENCWREYENLKFFDEHQEDMEVHFLHADTCLLPKHVLTQAIQYPLPYYELILVDDYWLSFVISHYLHLPIQKIKGNHLFSITEAAEDASVALYLNKRVMEERIRMYIHHMRQGWPNNIITDN